MPHYLSDDELKRTAPAEIAAYRGPVPTQIVSNGEYNPLPQTREQRRVEARIKELADDLGAAARAEPPRSSWPPAPAWPPPSSR